MTAYRDVMIGDLFEPVGGSPKFVRDYIETNRGDNPVYSASLTGPFGYVKEFEYEGNYLTWVMNGYGGRVQEIGGRFALTRDRGIFIPKSGIEIPDLTYLRFAMEPQLMAAAVGRRVDGRRNEYTKIYRDTVRDVSLRLLVDERGHIDHEAMAVRGAKLRRVERAQALVHATRAPLADVNIAFKVTPPYTTVNLSDSKVFDLSIGNRVLRSEFSESGIPVYSANVIVPFGKVSASNLTNFDHPSLLWGIDGPFVWNLIPAGVEFATTDHCGRLLVLDNQYSPDYIYSYLMATRGGHGFDRVYRASLRNIKSNVTVPIPLDNDGKVSVVRQRDLASKYQQSQRIRQSALTALDDVLKARMAAES
ncbi:MULTISPECIES: hypothetical protein [Nocardiaceae]|uniref:Restriction endonuclease S subunit n=1 Tax=Rhodococcoides corynebacterioides TaxID=53972 RepID=A0ABS2KV59_9NOCA|nr:MULTISPECIES: hypothetical protein [Rhodococcus]MBM7415830.1 restriction endonuclease S subunit [Rhodococcus corynebacterioides]MBP1118292.1 restriction endonuclease S subunit [Rhodococcus sp. PvP016]